MQILAIETSCDETAIALVGASDSIKQSRFKIIKNLVASQIKIHAPFGGVVPNLAKREHLKNLPILLNKIFQTSIWGSQTSQILTTNFRKSDFLNIDLIAVTVGPGLEPALWTGINFAKEIYKEIRKSGNKKIELIGVSHLEGHLYSFLLLRKTANSKSEILNPKQKSLEFGVSSLEFPAVQLLVSGGHTILIKMDSLTKYKKLGETRDDAVGESFDKVARLLNLPYPGGPQIEKLAKRGNPNAINFPRPMLAQKNYDFSFSGLKTAALYYIRDSEDSSFHETWLSDVAASFQKAAFDAIITKTLRAAKEFNAKSIMVSGGVASNFSLQKNLKLKIKIEKLKINVFFPPKKFCVDNAAMIAAAGYINYLRNKRRRLIANGNLTI